MLGRARGAGTSLGCWDGLSVLGQAQGAGPGLGVHPEFTDWCPYKKNRGFREAPRGRSLWALCGQRLGRLIQAEEANDAAPPGAGGGLAGFRGTWPSHPLTLHF